jgi:hypothetical protein
MNRKFFTWVAGTLLLAASFGAANAQTEVTVNGTTVKKIATFPNSDGKLYQLHASTSEADSASSTNGYLLTLKANDEFALAPISTSTNKTTFEGNSTTFGGSLWCLQFDSQNQGQNPKIDFTNKAFGKNLVVDLEQAVPSYADTASVTYGDLGGWGFSQTYKTDIEKAKPLYTYFHPDSVLVLAKHKTTNQLVIVRRLATAKTIDADDGTPLYFTIKEPLAIQLDATNFNTILSTQKEGAVKLTFDKDRNNTTIKNPWSDYSLRAQNSASNLGYLTFAQTKSNGAVDSAKFLRVDTAFINTSGTKFLAFTFDSIATRKVSGTSTPVRNSIFANQYDFKVMYDVANDSMSIQVLEAITEPDDKGLWHTAGATKVKTTDYGYGDKLFVKLQDLSSIDQIRVITLGDAPAGTKIKLNYGCDFTPGESTLTSIAEDVYIIHNSEGQVFGVPIYAPGNTPANATPQWITYNSDNVDPKYIPAYQWIVKKSRTTNLDYSPIHLTNREFDEIVDTKLKNIQLLEKGNATLDGKGINKDSFTPVPAAQKKDSLLGYFYITEDEARLNTYDLNYLHELSSLYYLGQSSTAGDTALVVKQGKTEFKFESEKQTIDEDDDVVLIAYGYSVVPKTETIADLVQLKRASYKVKNGTRDLDEAASGSRYVLAPSKESTPYFRLKVNNTKVIEGKTVHYYALLNTDNLSDKTKLSISDDNLWAYSVLQPEQRTSAFAIGEYSRPLYRRFDKGSYTFGKGQETVEEPYGSEDNAPLWLKFTKQNNRGNQLLFENASPDNEYRQGLTDNSISFLGLYNKSQYPETDKFKYTFYVDTAYVGRPATAATSANPPATPKPQYMLAVRPDIAQPGWIYWETGSSVWDDITGKPDDWQERDLDSAEVAGLTRGYYLFNAQDSVERGNENYAGKAAYGAQGLTRLAFVDGVHRLDTFYVLPKSYKDEYTTRDLQRNAATLLYTLPAVSKHYLGANTHYENRYNGKTLNAGRNGKSFVFQFRLLSGPADEGNPSRAFLIETTTEKGSSIGPNDAKYVKIQNDVPVIGDEVNFAETDANIGKTQGGAEIFNVELGDEDGAVSNEKIDAASKVRVVSGAGSVNILNATGKKVTVTNILGQNLATQVISSNNARISLPQGIVVVAVEGEPAVKAIVSR